MSMEVGEKCGRKKAFVPGFGDSRQGRYPLAFGTPLLWSEYPFPRRRYVLELVIVLDAAF
jgi:hypothetical protein